MPKLSRVVTFYNPNNRMAVEAAALAREAARQFRRPISRAARHLCGGTASAPWSAQGRRRRTLISTSPMRMVTSQAQLVIDMATSKKLPTMFSEQSLVAMGGLASYGQNFHEIGRLSAKYVQKIMTGAPPGDLRVEIVDKFELVINLENRQADRPDDSAQRAGASGQSY